jgi:anti-sigma-K factor RskA
MSATDDPTGPNDGVDLLAAEYVMGVLDSAGRRRAEARLAVDEAFAREVAEWAARLGSLADEAGAVAPPTALWPRIAAALPPAAVAPLPRTATPPHSGLWQSLAFWRTAGLGAGAIAAAAVIALALVLTPPAAPPPLTATLMPQSGQAALMVTVDRGKDMLMVMPAKLAMPAERVAELWLIPPGGKPHSLGVVDAAQPRMMKVPAALMPALAPQTMLALSIEPAGGSPTGQPTGPVIASGMLHSI